MAPITPIPQLTTEYNEWIAKQGLIPMCADDLLWASGREPGKGRVGLSKRQKDWLLDFLDRWRKAELRERHFILSHELAEVEAMPALPDRDGEIARLEAELKKIEKEIGE